MGAIALCCFPHPTLSLASEQTLKDLKRSQGHHVEMRKVDLTNWVLGTSPKFTTRVKYQLHQGFGPDQKYGNPKHTLPSILINFTRLFMKSPSVSFLIHKLLLEQYFSS